MVEADIAGAEMARIPPLRLTVTRGRALAEIRSWLPEHSAAQKSVRVGGRLLPGEVGATLTGSPRILCLAPGEWLLISDDESFTSLMPADTDLALQGLVLTDVTDGVAVLSVSGPAARDVLSKSCGLDFHERVFTTGCCARTRFAQISVIIDCLDNPLEFQLYVYRSYVRHLHNWLEDAAVEFSSSPL